MLLSGGLLCHYDGSFSRSSHRASAARVICVVGYDPADSAATRYTIALEASWMIPGSSAVDSELAAAQDLLSTISALVRGKLLDFVATRSLV
jgi:hypothetical protein